MTRSQCPGHHRHWFSEYGSSGWRLPACVRCHAPNPAYPCPECDPVTGPFAIVTVGWVEARALDPVPHQAERYVIHARWQCRAVEAHHGEERFASDYLPPTATWRDHLDRVQSLVLDLDPDDDPGPDADGVARLALALVGAVNDLERSVAAALRAAGVDPG